MGQDRQRHPVAAPGAPPSAALDAGIGGSRPPPPPGPRERIPLRALLRFRRDPTGFLASIAETYGDVAHFRFGRRRLYLLSHPDLVREVLVARHREFIKSYALQRSRVLLGEGLLTSEGEFHLRQRRLAQPAFHRDRIAAYGAVMAEIAARFAGRWRDGEVVDMAAEMSRLTLEVVGRTLFDTEVGDEADALGGALTDAMVLFDRLTIPFSEWLDRLPLPSNRRFARARERLDATILRLIDEHRRPGDRGDLLSMLIDARDHTGDGGGMTDRQLRDEALTIFLAGHETVANALAWTWYLLSHHPEVAARLHAEVDEVARTEGPGPGAFPRLSYTRAVLAESMRLFPPAWVIGREPRSDLEIGGFAIPAGTIVMMSPWVLHRDPRFWDDPTAFRPERWLDGDRCSVERRGYLPFGAGPRKCIGEGFAWMEGVLVLATLARRWTARLVPEHPVETRPLITLRPRFGMRMMLRARG
jgi:cytochrome P450